MKRMICIALVAVMVVLGLVGCQKSVTINSIPAPNNVKLKWNTPNWQSKNVAIFSSSDSETEGGLEIRSSEALTWENQLWNQGQFQEKNVSQTVTVDLLGMKGTGTYQYSYYAPYSFAPTRRYACADNDEGNLRLFEVESDGRLSSAYLKESGLVENMLNVTDEEAESISKTLLSQFVNNIDEYEITIERVVDTYCLVGFHKYVKGHLTWENAAVTLSKNGDIESFSSRALGRISEDKVPEYSDADLIARAEAILDEFYTEEEKAKRPGFHYDCGCLLTMTGPDQYAVLCTVTCRWEDGISGCEFLFKV